MSSEALKAAKEGMAVRDRIDRARVLLNPPKVKLHKMPDWFTKRLRSFAKANGLKQPYDYVQTQDLLIPICGSTSWLDHWGTTELGPFVCCRHEPNFVAEPYSFSEREAKSLMRLSESLNVEWHVTSDTWWNPGNTVRITIHEKHP